MFWSGAASPITSATAVSDGKFHHIVVTYDGATQTTYLDGVSIGSQAFAQQADGGPDYFQLGTGYAPGWPGTNGQWYSFNGLIDEAAVYSGALTTTQAELLFAAGKNGKCVATRTNVTVQTSASGAALTVDGTTYSAPQTFAWIVGSNHTIVAQANIASGNTRAAFASWSDGSTSNTEIYITPASAATLTATYKTQYKVVATVSPSGAGTITTNPTSPDGFFDAGSQLQLIAAGNSGYQFLAWSGGTLNGSNNPATLTLNGPVSVNALFTNPGYCPRCL